MEVDDRQSRIAWQIVNEMNKRKRTFRAKLKATSQKKTNTHVERTFQESARKSPKVADKPITKIKNNPLDIKLGQFTLEELDIVLTKIKKKTGKLPILMKYHQKY